MKNMKRDLLKFITIFFCINLVLPSNVWGLANESDLLSGAYNESEEELILEDSDAEEELILEDLDAEEELFLEDSDTEEDYIASDNNDAKETPFEGTTQYLGFNVKLGKVIITKCLKDVSEITIPEKINGMPVIGIQEGAFCNQKKLTHIIVPKTISSIGAFAFKGCTNMQSITILNPECAIFNADTTIPQNAVIKGWLNSYAEMYAKGYERKFLKLDVDDNAGVNSSLSQEIFIDNSAYAQADQSDVLKVSKLTSSKGNTLAKGVSTIIKASAGGGSGEYKYRFWIKDSNGKNTIIKKYSSENSVSWKPASSGKKTIYVDVKDSKGATARLALNVNVVSSLTVTGISSTKGTHLLKGIKTQFKVSAIGGKGKYTYKFVVKNAKNQNVAVRKYSSQAYANWIPKETGNNTLYVYVKDASGKVVQKSINLAVNAKLSVSTFNSSKGNNIVKGVNTRLLAAASGGYSNYTYRFLVKYSGKTETVISSYSATNSVIWKPEVVGNASLYVDVKDSQGNVARKELKINVLESFTPDGEYYTKLYGIANNGTDCTKPLQALIDTVWKEGGGTIVFDKGTFAFTSINLRSNVSLKGQGIGVTCLKRLNGNTIDGAFICIPYYAQGFSIEKLGIWGDKNKDSKITDGIKIQDVQDSDGNKIWGYDGDLYDFAKNPSLIATETEYRTYKHGYIENVYVYEFTGNGYYVGAVNYALTMRDFTAYGNNGIGMYNLSTDNIFNGCYLESNGQYGLYNQGGNNKFSNIKSIWNGTKNHNAYGIMNDAPRCQYSQVEVQDNYCGGICIYGNDNTFVDILSDCNGYLYGEKTFTIVQDKDLLVINGERNKVIGTCSQYKTNYEPVARYAVVMQNCKECKIYVTIDKHCSARGSIVDESQFIGDKLTLN